MNPRTQFFFYALWTAHPVLQGIVAWVMYRRKLHQSFPVFFSYILSQIIIFAIVFPLFLSDNYMVFFYVYASCIGISAAIGFKVIYEVFLDVFRPYHTLKDLGSVLFMWAGLVMLLVAGVVAASSSNTDQGPLWQAVTTAQRCVRVIQVGLIMFLVVFSKYLGVSRKQHSFGIALGFGSFACAELLLVALRAGSYIGATSANFANMAVYNGAIITWLVYVAAKDGVRDTSANMLMSQRWDQSLTELQLPASADSLIPMFEGMVDRALSRTQNDSEPQESERLVSQMSSLSVSERTSVHLGTLPRRPPEPK
jgi:hypothetical protein